MPKYLAQWSLKEGYTPLLEAGETYTLTAEEADYYLRQSPGILSPVAGGERAAPPAAENRMDVRPVENRSFLDAAEVDATNSAIDLAKEYGIDLAYVQGSGAGGRIIKRDVAALINDGA